MDRRLVTSRSNPWIQLAAAKLARTSITPNQISVASVLFALLVPAGLFGIDGVAGAAVAIGGIQLRLLANVLDGLVAVEGGKGSRVGALYNEFPDRIADSIVLVAFGYAVSQPALGWLAALLAALTAYVRIFGGSLGQAQSFLGPMAKQHRMAVVTVALIGMAGLPTAWSARLSLACLLLIVGGAALTCIRRTRAICSGLQGQPQ
ncbi:CDP-alcohol phosphatidyltransferase family protein [Ramlibacter aurantiacus]|nr:CDP-alcohol phosphatidyltransferase family protein [Ramlibacter aurantiacus]